MGEWDLGEQVLKACGESTKTIVLGVVDPQELYTEVDDNRFIQQIVSLVTRYCTAVERLKFNTPVLCDEVSSNLLSKLSLQLRSIDWRANPGHGCFRLPDFGVCKNIQRLTAPCSRQILSLLERSGSEIESLHVTFGNSEGYGQVIDAIEHNCKKLKNIRLPDCC